MFRYQPISYRSNPALCVFLITEHVQLKRVEHESTGDHQLLFWADADMWRSHLRDFDKFIENHITGVESKAPPPPPPSALPRLSEGRELTKKIAKKLKARGEFFGGG